MTSAVVLLGISTIHAARAADYTGDGIDDLAVGVPGEGFGGVSEGAVEVIRGSSSGLTVSGDALIHQDTSGVPSSNNDSENFGAALAAGDVDGDGRDDLIVGGPFDVIARVDAGAVWRLELGITRTSLSVTTAQFVAQNAAGVSDTSEADDEFGFAVAVGDFNGDGYDDVVMGVPGEDVGTITDAGAVEFLPGGSTGLTTTGELYYDQDVSGVDGSAESGDEFGYALTAGDFDGDDYDDLAIGIPYEDWSGTDEGSVHVMYGSSIGPGVTSPDDELWSAGSSSSVAGTLQDDNDCGHALTTGDFDGDGYDELAIGCRGYDVGSTLAAGAVLALYGSSSGLDVSELWNQDTSGVLETAEDLDYFGEALTSGDYDGDGYADLAIGVQEDAGGLDDRGGVEVLFGSATGLTDVGDVWLAQDVGSAVAGTPDAYDNFGAALASGDYNDDGLDDLAVGSPYDSESLSYAGVVNVFYGSASGPSTSGDQLFGQDTVGIEDTPEYYDFFGRALR